MYLKHLAEAMESMLPKAAEILWEAKDDILVYKTFPNEHHRSINSVNPLERLNREIRRRELVVDVLPDQSSDYHLIVTILINVDKDWRSGRCYIWLRKVFKNSLILGWK